MKVKCINCKPIDESDPSYKDLIEGNIYFVWETELNWYRIIGYLGKPYLYGKKRFEIIDDEMNTDWEKKSSEDDQNIYFQVPQLRGYLFERYFDNERGAIKIFENYVLCKFKENFGELEAIKIHPKKYRRVL